MIHNLNIYIFHNKMKLFVFHILFCILYQPFLIVSNSNMSIVGYYASWSLYCQGDGKFLIEDIDPNLCSHLVYAFAGLGNDNTIRALDPYKDEGDNGFLAFNALKNVNKQLKTLIGVGGWNEGSTKYSNMVANADTRKCFIDSVLIFLKKYGFDGLDMDWEYPGCRGGVPQDKENFVLLLKELKEAFAPKGYLLTAAVGAGKSTIDAAYDIPGISQYLDLINIMCYDYHGSWESQTGHCAPLYARPDELGDQRYLNADYTIQYWLSSGAPKEKLIMGIPFYGRTFTLANPENHGLGASASGPGAPGPYKYESGFVSFNEFREMRNTIEWTVARDPDQRIPFAYRDNQWVGFDDGESIAEKVNYIKSKQLAGAMVWSIDTDDFKGKFFPLKYPLLTCINRILQTDQDNF